MPLIQLKRKADDDAVQRALADYTSPGILLSPDYSILASNPAYEVHYGKAVTKGDRCFRVSHGYSSPCDENGESCPLKEAARTGSSARVCHVHHHPDGPEHVDVTLHPVADEHGVWAYVELIQPVAEASARAKDQAFAGRSRAFSEMLSVLRRGAKSEVPLLLLGETGSGKELAARAAHEMSARADGPFVPLECTGLSDALFESELFGHKRGAFTGADADKPGLVEVARGGTLFLDEVGEIPLHQQVKLLRLLESQTYRVVGETRLRTSDFRLICATHRDLKARVDDGRFRNDLYFRVSAFPVDIPPLRARLTDLPLLSTQLLNGTGKRLSVAALDALMAYAFPGNVRELKNILERAALLCDDDLIAPEHLPVLAHVARSPQRNSSFVVDEVVPLDEVQDRYVRWALARGESRAAVAAALGVSERTLYRRLRGAG